MSNLRSSQPTARVQARALSPFNRSLWLTLLFGLGLIAALLFVFSARSIAAPSETTISQRVQNSVLTNASAVTGTYGEVLTVTMRFTITTGTVLTGPINLTTRFAGVLSIPSSQLGFRFLDYQAPIAIGGAPALAVNNFVSNTSGVAPNITTILTWTFNTITNTSGNSYVYEVPYQVRFVGDGVADTATNAAIPSQGSQTYITWSPYTGNDRKAANGLTVNLIKPDLGAQYSTKTAYVSSVAGNATVAYTITLKNGNNATGFIPAQDLVVTDVLDSHLTFVAASPVPSDVTTSSGQTILTWAAPNWSLAPNTTWMARVTATLPSTFAANTVYTNTVIPDYTTWPGNVPDEFEFAPIVSATVKGGILGTKQASPNNNVRIGDIVTYTVRITVNPGIYLNTPIFTDTLPKGFHYLPGTFNLTGALVQSGSPITSVTTPNENLSWAVNDIPANASPLYATVTYATGVTGVGTDGSLAYVTQGELSGGANAVNAVQASWQDSTGNYLALLSPWSATARIVQPYLVNNFGVTIDDWQPITAPLEVGSVARYNLAIRNSAAVTAYEVVLSNLLPDGVSYQGAPSISPLGLQLLQVPTVGSQGTVQFIINQVPPATTVNIRFDARVENTARPGDLLVDRLSLTDFSSQLGGKNDGNGNDSDFTGVYDRQYGAIAAAIPTPAIYSYTLKGLTAVKTDIPDPVLPGQAMTYLITYTNSSAVYAAPNTVITDTYDPLLTFVSSNPAPSAHDLATRRLSWNIGTLNASSGEAYITANFTVATGVSRTVRTLTNTITSDSASPAPAMSRVVTTTLVQPKPTINLDDKGVTVKANDIMTYTMVYSNASAVTGATTGTFTITLDYAPYVTFITYTATPANPPGPRLVAINGTVFTDTLGPGISRTVQLRMQVARPLPYSLTSFTSTATIYQSAVDISDSESEETPVLLPTYQVVKTRTTPGNPPVIAGEGIAYVIRITNTSSITGTNLTVTDVWDANTYNQLGTSNWTLQGSYGVYTTIATLAPGASIQLDALNMNVTPILPANAQVIRNTVLLTSRETTQQQTVFDTPIVGLNVQKTHTPDPVFPGEVMTYTIAYALYGTPAASPMITDTLPPEVTYINCYPTIDPTYPNTCTHTGGKVVWSWSALPAGYTGVITVVVQAPNTEWITLTNNYASNSASGAPYREGPTDYTYVGRPHLSVTKQASTVVTPAAPGDLIFYTLTYANAGSYKATNVMAHDTIPVNTTFFSCSGAPCSETNGIVDWSLGEVPITTTRVVTLVVRANPTAGTTTIVNNVYSLSADRHVTNENTPPTVNTAIVRPALTVVKSVAPSWLELGQFITYTVRYTNTGGGTFTMLLFTDTISSRLKVESTSSSCTAVPNTVVTCTDTNLLPGQSRQFTVTVSNISMSNNEVITNFVRYLAANQTEVLPEGQSNLIEVPVSNVGAAADFVGAPTGGPFPLNVTFTNLSNGTGITSCLWNFGDSSTSTSCGATVSHVYNQTGVFTVSLTVNTGSGSNTRTRPAYILVGGAADYGVSITSPQPAKRGARGSQISYTLVIVNTGNVPDSFTLSLPTSGYNWITNLSTTSTGTLQPHASTTVTATVNIPTTGSLVDSDVVTITARSNSSGSVSSSVALKTSTPAYAVYLPLILR